MLLWASKFATAKIEHSFEMGKSTPLGVTHILLVMAHVGETTYYFMPIISHLQRKF